MKKLLIIIIVFLTSGICYGQKVITITKGGDPIQDTINKNRHLLGEIVFLHINFEDSTYQIGLRVDTRVDSISMKIEQPVLNKTFSGSTWLPFNTGTMNKICAEAKMGYDWKNGKTKNKTIIK